MFDPDLEARGGKPLKLSRPPLGHGPLREEDRLGFEAQEAAEDAAYLSYLWLEAIAVGAPHEVKEELRTAMYFKRDAYVDAFRKFRELSSSIDVSTDSLRNPAYDGPMGIFEGYGESEGS